MIQNMKKENKSELTEKDIIEFMELLEAKQRLEPKVYLTLDGLRGIEKLLDKYDRRKNNK